MSKGSAQSLLAGVMIGVGLAMIAVGLDGPTVKRVGSQTVVVSPLPVPTQRALGCVRRLPGFVPLAELPEQPWDRDSVLLEPSVTFPDEQLAETVSLYVPETIFYGKPIRLGALPPFDLITAYATVYRNDGDAAAAARAWNLKQVYRQGRLLIAMQTNSDEGEFISEQRYAADHPAVRAFERKVISCFTGK